MIFAKPQGLNLLCQYVTRVWFGVVGTCMPPSPSEVFIRFYPYVRMVNMHGHRDSTSVQSNQMCWCLHLIWKRPCIITRQTDFMPECSTLKKINNFILFCKIYFWKCNPLYYRGRYGRERGRRAAKDHGQESNPDHFGKDWSINGTCSTRWATRRPAFDF